MTGNNFWNDSARYDYLRSPVTSLQQWAWEFLRRNSTFIARYDTYITLPSLNDRKDFEDRDDFTRYFEVSVNDNGRVVSLTHPERLPQLSPPLIEEASHWTTKNQRKRRGPQFRSGAEYFGVAHEIKWPPGVTFRTYGSTAQNGAPPHIVSVSAVRDHFCEHYLIDAEIDTFNPSSCKAPPFLIRYPFLPTDGPYYPDRGDEILIVFSRAYSLNKQMERLETLLRLKYETPTHTSARPSVSNFLRYLVILDAFAENALPKDICNAIAGRYCKDEGYSEAKLRENFQTAKAYRDGRYVELLGYSAARGNLSEG